MRTPNRAVNPVGSANRAPTTPREEAPARRRNDGGASNAIITSPAPMNSKAISAPVRAVTAMRIAEIAHSRASRPLVSRASLTAATAMIAMTAGAIP